VRGRRSEPLSEPLLRDPEERHTDEAGRGEGHPEHADVGMLCADQMPDRLEPDVWGEKEELDHDELLRPLLGSVGQQPVTGEAPDDYDAGDALDRSVDPEADQGDRPGEDAGRDRDRALRAHPRQAEPRELLGAAGTPPTRSRTTHAESGDRPPSTDLELHAQHHISRSSNR
jgi:hypothetical protein